MSSTSRGRQAEDHAKAVLEADAWIVDLAVPEYRKRWDPISNDYVTKRQYDRFGCFDLVCVHPDGYVKLVQVTHPSGVSERRQKIRDAAAWPVAEPWFTVELWVWHGAGFHVHRLEADEGWVKANVIPVEVGG